MIIMFFNDKIMEIMYDCMDVFILPSLIAVMNVLYCIAACEHY